MKTILPGAADYISELEATAISNRLGRDLLHDLMMYSN